MNKNYVASPSDALAYILDCNLATVAQMAMKKSRPRGEFERQILIAQTNLDWCLEFGSDISKTRGAEVASSYSGRVSEWVRQYIAD